MSPTNYSTRTGKNIKNMSPKNYSTRTGKNMSPKTEQHSNRKRNMNKHPSKHDTSSKQKQTHKAKIKITFKQNKNMSPGPRGSGAGGILKDFCWFCWGPELSPQKSFQDAPSRPWGVPFKGALRALEILSRRPNKALKRPFKCP